MTYELGESKVDYPSPLGDSTLDANGFGIAGRLGFHINESFWIAIDGRYSMPGIDDSNYTAPAVSTNYGPAIGIQMPNFGLRLWGVYVLGGEMDPEADGSLDVKFEEASGYRIGVGINLSIVSLNLEYQDLKYDTMKLEKIGPFSPGTSFDSVNGDLKSWIASVSFPLAP